MNRLFGTQTTGERLPATDDGSVRRTAPAARRAKRERQAIACATFVPAHYEARYAYPLLVWLHGRGSSEQDLMRRMEQLSNRNYVVLAPRGPVPCPSPLGGVGYRWPRTADGLERLDDQLFWAIRGARRRYHVHSERIWLAGCGDGGTLAYRLALLYPDRFAGVVALNAGFPRRPAALAGLRWMRHLKVFVGHSRGNAAIPLEHALGAARLLRSAGLDTTWRVYSGVGGVAPKMLADVNRWLIQRIVEA